jgi:tetratricopeptide (TPR) repeat protein
MASSKISQFKQLTEIDPSEATFFGLGRAYMEEGYFEDAADAFYKAIEKNQIIRQPICNWEKPSNI